MSGDRGGRLHRRGSEGSGGVSAEGRVRDALVEDGRGPLLVREPGGTELGERVRALLLDPALQVDPVAELLLFSAARAQLVAEVIRPALAAGRVVLADRFFDSTIAYQGAGRGVAEPGWLAALQRRVTGGLAPARTYYIDVPPEEAARRRQGCGEADRMERAGDAFFARVREAYRTLAAAEPGRVVTLDGTLPPEALAEAALADLRAHLLAGTASTTAG